MTRANGRRDPDRGPHPLAPLNVLVERTLTVADLATGPLWTVSADEPAADAAATLAAREFDVAGVTAEPVTHYVTLEDLASTPHGAVRDVARPILAAECVESTLPLADLLELLAERHYVFVLDHHRVRSLVHRADLQAPAIGVVVLAYLTVIETGLRPLVLEELGDGWLEHLTPDRRADVRLLYERKRRHGAQIGYEDCLCFSDWVRLARRCPGVLRALGYDTVRRFERDVGAFTTLRNDLAHGGTILDSAGGDPRRAVERVHRIRALAHRVWDERPVPGSLWDRYAATILVREDTGQALTGPGASDALPGATPMHVLTAWNPGSVHRPDEMNRRANDALARVLHRRGVAPTPVVGTSPDGRWSEESLLVGGMRREHAVDLGRRFGQLAIFELTPTELLVVRCADARIVRRTPRRHDPRPEPPS